MPLAAARSARASSAGQLVVLGGDDDLAAPLARRSRGDRTRPISSLAPGAAQLGLLRAGRVVEAGVDHAGVVAALVRGDRRLLVDHDHRRRVGPAATLGPWPGRRSRRR